MCVLLLLADRLWHKGLPHHEGNGDGEGNNNDDGDDGADDGHVDDDDDDEGGDDDDDGYQWWWWLSKRIGTTHVKEHVLKPKTNTSEHLHH